MATHLVELKLVLPGATQSLVATDDRQFIDLSLSSFVRVILGGGRKEGGEEGGEREGRREERGRGGREGREGRQGWRDRQRGEMQQRTSLQINNNNSSALGI